MSFTVNVTQNGSSALGTHCNLIVVTGQAASPIGQTAGATSITPSLAITPTGTGSLVYGSNLGLTGTYTPNAATTYKSDVAGNGLEYVALRSTATTSAGTPVTLGGTATVNSISIVLLEILNGTGLAEDGSSPGAFGASATTATSSAFTPPGSSLLVLMIATNGAAGVVGVTVTDTSGLGLVWTQRVSQAGAGNGLSAVWTSVMPATAAGGGGVAAGDPDRSAFKRGLIW